MTTPYHSSIYSYSAGSEQGAMDNTDNSSIYSYSTTTPLLRAESKGADDAANAKQKKRFLWSRSRSRTPTPSSAPPASLQVGDEQQLIPNARMCHNFVSMLQSPMDNGDRTYSPHDISLHNIKPYLGRMKQAIVAICLTDEMHRRTQSIATALMGSQGNKADLDREVTKWSNWIFRTGVEHAQYTRTIAVIAHDVLGIVPFLSNTLKGVLGNSVEAFLSVWNSVRTTSV